MATLVASPSMPIMPNSHPELAQQYCSYRNGLRLSTDFVGIGSPPSTFGQVHALLVQNQSMVDTHDGAINLSTSAAGTCGLASIANVVRLVKKQMASVRSVRQFAESHELSVELIDVLAEQWFTHKRFDLLTDKGIVGKIGGTCADEIDQILQAYDLLPDHRDTHPNLQTIRQHIICDEPALVYVHAQSVFKGEPGGDLNHVVTLTGIEIDQNAIPIGFWIQDTGDWTDHPSSPASFVTEDDLATTWKTAEFTFVRQNTRREAADQPGCPS